MVPQAVTSFAAGALLLLVAGGAAAQSAGGPTNVLAPEGVAPLGQPDTTAATGLSVETAQPSTTLLGDRLGIRPALGQLGVTVNLQETSEVLGNVTGGTRRAVAYDGLFQAAVSVDTEKAFGWAGGTFNVSALQIHGRNLSSETLLTLQTASGIEANRATRLWELWYEQKAFGDRVAVRVGQQSADQEFLVNQDGTYLNNTMFGWPVTPSVDLPGGGPAYPLSAPAVRVRVKATEEVAVLAAVFSGSPTPRDGGDPQRTNASGTSFPVRGALVIGEVQYNRGTPGQPAIASYKLGGFYDTRRFDDLRLGSDGLSLADPASSGVPRRRRGMAGVYAVADQVVWTAPGMPGRTVSVFGRVVGMPQSDRALVDFSFNGGVVLHRPFEGRADDTAALGVGYARVGSAAVARDRDATVFNPMSGAAGYGAVRSGETVIEASYQAQVLPWWQLQPDAQYVFHPGGGIANPLRPTQRVRDELVLGVRSSMLF